MTIQEMVRADYIECIELSKCSSELKGALKTNERVPVFINRISDEIKKCEKAGIKLDRLKIKEVTYSLTELFLRQIEEKAKAMMASDAEKSRLRNEDELKSKLDKDGNADLTEEIGVLIKDRDDGKARGQTN